MPTLDALPTSQILVTGGTKTERKRVRAWLKSWAKYTHITSVTLKKSLGKNITGLCYAMGYGASRIEIRSGMSKNKLKKVLAHEIAHATANFVYRNYTYTVRQDALLAAFGRPKRLSTSPSEAQADCMAQVKAGKKYLSYQRGGCSKTKLSRAKKLWKGQFPLAMPDLTTPTPTTQATQTTSATPTPDTPTPEPTVTVTVAPAETPDTLAPV
ncbi:MAG: hypothetical protein LBR58_04240 [Propionibacteriaceae bacterium]|nr:hypothetical protein [Propionibacteriaceae bacterium]